MEKKMKRTGVNSIISKSRCFTGVFLLTLLGAAASICGVLQALVLKEVVDSAVGSEKNAFLRYVFLWIILMATVICIQSLVRYINERTRVSIENRLKAYVYQIVMNRDYRAISEYKTGEVMNRMCQDTTTIADSIVSVIPGITAMLVKLIAAMTVIAVLDIRFALLFLAGGLALIFTTYAFRKFMKKLHKEVSESDDNVKSFMQESVMNLLMIKTFASEEKMNRIADDYMSEYKKKRMRRNHFSNICNIGFSLVMNCGYLFGLIWGGLGIIRGTVSYGTLMAVFQLVGQIQQPFANITGYIPKYYAMLAAFDRITELEKLPKEMQEQTEEIREFKGIDIQNVTFGYDSEFPVLKNASLQIAKGDCVAIMGESGIGKSTLLKLLLSVYNTDKGEICIKSESGLLPLGTEHRKLFAYVPQGSFLVSGTVRDNIAFADSGSPDENKVIKAAHISCADTFIDKLEDKYDYVLGERGAGLSEGQIQRLAIARALYSNAPVILLDEATSALDEKTERELLRNIQTLTDKTVVLVTHRKAALDICNRIVKVKDGNITEIEM